MIASINFWHIGLNSIWPCRVRIFFFFFYTTAPNAQLWAGSKYENQCPETSTPYSEFWMLLFAAIRSFGTLIFRSPYLVTSRWRIPPLCRIWSNNSEVFSKLKDIQDTPMKTLKITLASIPCIYPCTDSPSLFFGHSACTIPWFYVASGQGW